MARATNFSDLCDLIERAEDALISSGGITDPNQRILMLRGIFYGTPWSTDYRVERSWMRNLGMTLYTGFGIPPDPRPALGTSLFNDVQNSQDVREGRYMVDTGHAFIGMEARSNYIARTLTFPQMGGTGIEIVTWLGDLGGGAANLAWLRSANARAASRRVNTVFRTTGSDYGAPINLEGDLAGYLIGASSTLAAPSFPRRTKIADLFRAYLPINASSRARYARRCRDFLTIMGGRFRGSGSNQLTGKSTLIGRLADKLSDFGEVYMLQRYILGQGIARTRIEDACKHLRGAAREVATVFVNGLEHGVSNPRRAVRGVGPWPRPTPPASGCASRTLAQAAREREITETVDRTIREGRRTASEWIRRLEETTEDVIDSLP